MATPDVTVVVAVYNTMPYLTECLESIFGQTIGAGRMQVVAVDDGSTDDSGAELDRWQARFPQAMTVLHQANSGGPAGPSNRALDVATGRYVFFLGADDRLGLEALERLVRAADETGADVVLGRLVGDGGRYVNQAVFADGNRDDIDLVNSPLAWALSNTKLFRRSLIEEHRIRYREEMASCSDQPFTIRAVVAARRIAVRADYDYYYAVRRADGSNITYRSSLGRFLPDTATLLEVTADLITDPEARHNVLVRHFSWEVGKLLGERLLGAPRDQQALAHLGVRKLADNHLTEAARAALPVRHRVAISMAQFGTLGDVLAVARHYAAHGHSPLVADGDRFYLRFPSFRAAGKGFPDAWFDITDELQKADRQTAPARVRWDRDALTVSWESALPPQPGEKPPVLAVEDGPTVPVTALTARLPLDAVVAGERRLRLRKLTFARSLAGRTIGYDLKVEDVGVPRRLHRVGVRFYLVGVVRGRRGALRVTVLPLMPRPLAGRLWHGLLSAVGAVRRTGSGLPTSPR